MPLGINIVLLRKSTGGGGEKKMPGTVSPLDGIPDPCCSLGFVGIVTVIVNIVANKIRRKKN